MKLIRLQAARAMRQTEQVPEFCTCGAQLVPDARFCHKCGKPQREEPGPRWTEAKPEQPGVRTFQPPSSLGLRNPEVRRVGLIAASLGALLSILPYVGFGFIIWLFSAGFFSVYLYRRRTGHLLTIRNGARLGWITGVLSSLILSAISAFNIVPVAIQHGGLASLYKEQLKSWQLPEKSIEDALHILQSPVGVMMVILAALLLLFTFVSLVCAAGGAVGAKILHND